MALRRPWGKRRLPPLAHPGLILPGYSTLHMVHVNNGLSLHPNGREWALFQQVSVLETPLLHILLRNTLSSSFFVSTHYLASMAPCRRAARFLGGE
jgi:hypothetical protein